MMGMETSIPVAPQSDAFVAVSLSGYGGKVRIINAGPDVRDMFVRLDNELSQKWGSSSGPLILDYFGTIKMKVGNRFTFTEGAGKDAGTMGKVFAVRCFEEMYKLGYNLVVSSDLTRASDNGTWYFAKSLVPSEDRSQARVCCIAPGGTRSAYGKRIKLLRHDEHIKQAVHLALEEAWPNGLNSSEDDEAVGEIVHVLKLSGIWGGTHTDGINTRRFICNLMGRMGSLNWRLLASTNIKGTCDTYFFIWDPTFMARPNDFCMITLSKHDRFRLIDCNHLAEPLKAAVTAAGLVVDEELEYYGCHELKVQGNPWWCENAEAIMARRSISRILEMMAQQSLMPYTAIDVSRRLTDKTSFLFKKSEFPVNCNFACLSMTSYNRIRLLDFPVDVGVAMRNVIYECYPFGVKSEVNLPDCNLEINLNDYPFVRPNFTKGASMYHIRAVLGRMMRIAETHGWYLSVSGDISAKYVKTKNSSYSVDVHSLYFIKMN